MDDCKNRAPGSLEWEETDSHSVEDNEACKAAWRVLKPKLAPTNWTAGESCTYYGFFSWGWTERKQYDNRQPEIDELKNNANELALSCALAVGAAKNLEAERDILKAENERLRDSLMSVEVTLRESGQYLLANTLCAAITAPDTPV